jgi:hypothetical protein
MSDFAQIRFQPNRPLLRELSADRLNTILQEIKRNKPKGERGITVRQDGTGTYVGLAASLPRGGTSTPATTHPFQINSTPVTPQGGGTPTQFTISDNPGTINGIIAGNWQDTFSINGSAVRYVILTAQTDGYVVETATLSVATTLPQPAPAQLWALSDSFTVILGAVQESNVKQIVFDNLSANGAKRLTVEKAAPELNQLPYDNYYAWAVTS